jgi:hypothetical protein
MLSVSFLAMRIHQRLATNETEEPQSKSQNPHASAKTLSYHTVTQTGVLLRHDGMRSQLESFGYEASALWACIRLPQPAPPLC